MNKWAIKTSSVYVQIYEVDDKGKDLDPEEVALICFMGMSLKAFERAEEIVNSHNEKLEKNNF